MYSLTLTHTLTHETNEVFLLLVSSYLFAVNIIVVVVSLNSKYHSFYRTLSFQIVFRIFVLAKFLSSIVPTFTESLNASYCCCCCRRCFGFLVERFFCCCECLKNTICVCEKKHILRFFVVFFFAKDFRFFTRKSEEIESNWFFTQFFFFCFLVCSNLL